MLWHASWHIRPPKSPSIFLAEPQWSSLPHMIAILLLLFPFQPFCSAWSLALMMCMFLPVIFLATCAMLPLLYSVCTFQFLIFLIFLGVYRLPIQLGGVLLPLAPTHHRIAPIVRTGHSVPLIKWIFSACGFCNDRVLEERTISPHSNPNLKDY